MEINLSKIISEATNLPDDIIKYIVLPYYTKKYFFHGFECCFVNYKEFFLKEDVISKLKTQVKYQFLKKNILKHLYQLSRSAHNPLCQCTKDTKWYMHITFLKYDFVLEKICIQLHLSTEIAPERAEAYKFNLMCCNIYLQENYYIISF